MIENEDQLKLTRKWLNKFRRDRVGLIKMISTGAEVPFDRRFLKVMLSSTESQMDDFVLQIAAYKAMKSIEPKPLILPPKLRNIPERKKKWLQGLSRQQRYQQLRIMQNLCAGCGKEPLAGSRLGEKCLAKQRERMRK